MGTRDQLLPVVQIVHVSDLHVVQPAFPWWSRVRFLDRALRILGSHYGPQRIQRYRRMWESGAQGHSVRAPELFARFLAGLQLAPWDGLPTWIVDTGDLTTFGDWDSLKLAHDIRQSWKRGPLLAVHGNHDAWPGALPILATPGEIVRHRRKLFANFFKTPLPAAPLKARSPNGAEVQLYALDTVEHEAWTNLNAIGIVDMACATKLRTLVDDHQPEAGSLRLLATHHPVCHPNPQAPRDQMVLRNDYDLARLLAGASIVGQMPLVHLVLSGHVHELFPKHGRLPTSLPPCQHEPLQENQMQMTVGSLFQEDRFSERQPWPHQCALLRIYNAEKDRRLWQIERILVARSLGTAGPYGFVPLRGGPHVETCYVRTGAGGRP